MAVRGPACELLPAFVTPPIKEPTEWTAPLKPAGQDRFGVYFRVPLEEGATALTYILHRGDTKDQPEDQELDLHVYGHEVWVLGNQPGYLLPLPSQCEPTEQPAPYRAFAPLITQPRRND